MKAHSRYLIVAVLATSAILLLHNTPHSAAAKQGNKARRAIEQSRIDEVKRYNLNLNNLRSRYINDIPTATAFDRSIIHDEPRPGHPRTVSALVPPPPSPGIPIAVTSYDYQDNDSPGRRVARMPGADIVHFTWMGWDRIDAFGEWERYTYYNSYSIGLAGLYQGFGGVILDQDNGARAGYPDGDVWDDNTFQMVMHQRPDISQPYQPYHLSFPTPGQPNHIDTPLGGYGPGGCQEVLWSRIATSRDGDNTVHALAHSNTNDCPVDLLWYWRYNGTTWTGPIILDSTPNISYVMADDPTGDKVAVVVHVRNHVSMNGINNVAYLESMTDGAGWIADAEAKIKNVITNYNSDAGPGACLHLTAAYDHSGILHIVWDEQEDANDSPTTAIKHWNSQRQTVRTVALGYWETPMLTGIFNLNLAKITLGIGDGGTLCQGGAESNEDYLYVLYTQFGGPSPEEQADHSLEGYYNGELYLNVSATGGNTWSSPVNLTNTKTPNCNAQASPDSVCRSEHWATIGVAISDIDILFISDLDAGGIPQGEGTWQLNPVHYLRIPGGTTDAQYLCPLIAANFEATLTSTEECEYNATQLGQNTETLTIMNLGNGDLSGSIAITDFPSPASLSVSGSSGFSIIAGAADDVRTVIMAANGAAEGLYHGEISISHDDPGEASPRVFPIDFFIFNEFFCPQDIPGFYTGERSLSLQVELNGRFASQNVEAGLWRRSDSSSSIYDGSLLIAHGTQDVDTTVFHRFYERETNGQFGFRALSELVGDFSAYGTGGGCATVHGTMCTRDSVVGIAMDWYAPQSDSLDEFIVVRYKLYRHDPSTPVTNLTVGILADLEIEPASRYGIIQQLHTNEPGSDGPRNLIWASGVDTAGHPVIGQATARRYLGGMIFPGGFEGAIIGNAASDINPAGGPTDGFMYSMLQDLQGIDLFSVSDTDLYAMAALDRGRSISEGETLSYTMILLSDTVSEASLKATADLALANYQTMCTPCTCPCKYDPQCDGVHSDIQDVVQTIDVAFRGSAAIVDPGCPTQRTDVDDDGSTTVTDVVRVINVAFRGQTVAANYGDPCP